MNEFLIGFTPKEVKDLLLWAIIGIFSIRFVIALLRGDLSHAARVSIQALVTAVGIVVVLFTMVYLGYAEYVPTPWFGN